MANELARVRMEMQEVVTRSADCAGKLRELAERDLETIWNKLKSTALCGEYAGERLEAARLMMAYAVGHPGAAPAERSDGNRQHTPDLSEYSTDELRAISTLQAGARRRANGG